MSPDRPLVVHVTSSDISLELLLGPQLEAFAAAGYDVAGASAAGPYVPALERRGIAFHPLRHATRAMDPVEDLRALAELVTLFRRLRPSIVHTHNPKPGLYGRVAARLAGVPGVVNTIHGLYAQPSDPPRRRAVVYGLERVASTCSAAELVQNPEDIPVLQRLRIPDRKIRLLGNGIDLDRFDPDELSADEVAAARRELGASGPDDVVVGVVGRLVGEKGYHEVFAAARRLKADAPNVVVAVIGPSEPDKADGLSDADLAAATETGVHLLGERSDVERLYGGMDLFVLASHREGFPRSAMEAAAMGVPVVATDIRGCRQVVEHGHNGLLVPVGDEVALSGAIASLARDPETRRHMGDAGRAKARASFDQQTCIGITLDTYREVLESAGFAAPATVPR